MKNKYAIILGNLGNTCDRFCKSYKDNPSSEEMLKLALERMPFIEGIELVGTWDIRPDNVGDMKKRMDDAGVACASIIPDTFANPLFAISMGFMGGVCCTSFDLVRVFDFCFGLITSLGADSTGLRISR